MRGAIPPLLNTSSSGA